MFTLTLAIWSMKHIKHNKEELYETMQDAAAEAARIARGAKGSADNDLDSKSSDEKKAGRASGYVE
jgi:hypothetical protein